MKVCDQSLAEHRTIADCGDAEHAAALMRRTDTGEPWSPIIISRDGGGRRDFLDGQPIHCGTGLELQAFEVRGDDYGEWLVWLQQGVRVRYEMAWPTNPREDSIIMLHAIVAGYEFTKRLDSGMRFRWPQRENRR